MNEMFYSGLLYSVQSCSLVILVLHGQNFRPSLESLNLVIWPQVAFNRRFLYQELQQENDLLLLRFL